MSVENPHVTGFGVLDQRGEHYEVQGRDHADDEGKHWALTVQYEDGQTEDLGSFETSVRAQHEAQMHHAAYGQSSGGRIFTAAGHRAETNR